MPLKTVIAIILFIVIAGGFIYLNVKKHLKKKDGGTGE